MQRCRAVGFFVFNIPIQISMAVVTVVPRIVFIPLQHLACKTLTKTLTQTPVTTLASSLFVTDMQTRPTYHRVLSCFLIPALQTDHVTSLPLSDHSLSLTLFPCREHRVFFIRSKRSFFQIQPTELTQRLDNRKFYC